MNHKFLSLLIVFALLISPLSVSADCYPSPSPESSSSTPAGLLFKYIKILTPAPGAVLGSGGSSVQSSGSTYDITWTTKSSAIKYVDILYSTDLGDTYTEIVNHYPNTGTYPWVLPNIHSSQVIIRINAFGENNWNYGSVKMTSPFAIYNGSGSTQSTSQPTAIILYRCEV